ncbi:Zn-ribbon domain-containing OB-fold protein [Sphingomonas sp. C8-2]|jgi:uncharacterized OB-fold protein|nr:Zn-ribbon domain-containing OB-fold protein [Sphingomonas sp. C8-2]
MSDTRPLPEPTPETAAFWKAAGAGVLQLQRCLDGCERAYFPPRNFCPHCGSRNVGAFAASGRARLYSYVISHRPAPGFTPPYAVAVVELEEGPRMMSNIVDCEQTPEALLLDMPLKLVFQRQTDAISLPFFTPDRG